MRTNHFVNMMAFALAIVLWGCSPESNHPMYQDFDAGLPTIAASEAGHPAVEPICSEEVEFPIVDAQGGTTVNYCGGSPCTGPMPVWGSAVVFNDSSSIYINLSMAYEWFIEKVEVFAGDESVLNWNMGLPNPDSNWQVELLSTGENLYQVKIPVGDIGGQCLDLAVKIGCVKLDFFSGPDLQSATDLYVGNIPLDNNGVPSGTPEYVFPWCFESCGPEVTEITKGRCRRCNSEVTVTFYDCDSISVISCKNLSNVVLVYTDCTWEKFRNLCGNSGDFQGEGANEGKEISHVYVKSGCYRSGEGPGFGRRFDSPCVNLNCPPVTRCR